MQEPAKKLFSSEEYLALEEAADYKSEYYQGEIFAMAGASINHNQIAGNLYSALNTESVCRVFMTDTRLWVKKKSLFTYPDIMVVCRELEFFESRNDTITNPVAVLEVLSESTKNYDRGEKFGFYRAIASLQEYILIDQFKYHVEQFHIGSEGKWVLTEYDSERETLKFNNIEIEIPLVNLYRRVDFEMV